MVDLAEVYDLIIGQTGNYPSFRDNVLTCRIRELKLAREMGKPIVALCDSDSKLTPEQEKRIREAQFRAANENFTAGREKDAIAGYYAALARYPEAPESIPAIENKIFPLYGTS